MMGAQVKYGSVSVGAYYSTQPGSLQPGFVESRLDTRPDFSWQRRSAKTWRDRNAWASRWPTSRFSGGGGGAGADAMVVVGQGLECSGMFEPFSCDGEGTQSTKWIKGRCEDASGVAVANAIIQCFRTSDDAFGGQGVSFDDGTYQVPTQFPGVAHYVVAYKPGAPDVGGTTVNTLIPANIDGT